MLDFLSTLLDAVTDCLKKHGFIKTSILLMTLLFSLAIVILSWQLPDIIRAIQGR